MEQEPKNQKEKIDWKELGERQVKALLDFDANSEIFRRHPKIIGGRLLMGEE